MTYMTLSAYNLLLKTKKLDTNMHGIEEDGMLPAVGNLLLASVERGMR